MIRNRLSDLMGIKQIKISKLSSETGIARSTLTPLYYNQSSMIKLDTINTLCNFFQVDISDFFESTLFDFIFSVKSFGKDNKGLILKVNENKEYEVNLDLVLEVKIVEGKKSEIIDMNISLLEDEAEIDMFMNYSERDGKIIERLPESHLPFVYSFPNDDSSRIFKSYISRMSIGMYGVLMQDLIGFIKNELAIYFEDDDTNNKLKFPTISKSDLFKVNIHTSLEEKSILNYFGEDVDKED